MKVFRTVINENEYMFISEHYETSKTWGHKTVLFKNGITIGENKVRYINRTWESYTYQSVMQGLVYNLIESELKDAIEFYKFNMGIKRISPKDKKEITEGFYQSKEIKELNKLQEVLRTGDWN